MEEVIHVARGSLPILSVFDVLEKTWWSDDVAQFLYFGAKEAAEEGSVKVLIIQACLLKATILVLVGSAFS